MNIHVCGAKWKILLELTQLTERQLQAFQGNYHSVFTRLDQEKTMEGDRRHAAVCEGARLRASRKLGCRGLPSFFQPLLFLLEKTGNVLREFQQSVGILLNRGLLA